MSQSQCNQCGAQYPTALAGYIHKCGRCSGGYCSPIKSPEADLLSLLKEELTDLAEIGKEMEDVTGYERGSIMTARYLLSLI